MEMYNPAHPGKILKEWIDNKSVEEIAKRLHIEQNALLRILHGKKSITADFAVRLEELLPDTDAQFWLSLQQQYDLWQAKQRKHEKIIPLSQPLLVTA